MDLPTVPGEVFGTLTTLVGRTPAHRSEAGLHLLVLEATGLSVYPLPETGTIVIGRAEGCDVRLRDGLASRRHATLHVAPLAIEDCGSANGTTLGSRAVEPGAPVPLHLGHSIAIGSSLLIVRRAARPGVPALQAAPVAHDDPSIVVRDPRMLELYRVVERVAAAQINVLILGETGVGKDVVAETIHRSSPRKDGPLIRINCAALSEALLESELFGHERGAFTGAAAAKPGLIEVANGGTVFLDEVGELSLGLQAKLLRVIEAREVLRVGGVRPRAVDARFVAATNRNLEADVERGAFRSDLFFRLNGVSLTVPPLRERTAEIDALCNLLLTRASSRMHCAQRPSIAKDAMAALLAHHWPGNVRELRNVIERAVLLCTNDVIEQRDLVLSALSSSTRSLHVGSDSSPSPAAPTAAPALPSRAQQAQSEERQRIMDALQRCNGNQTRAAKLLAMPRRTLVAKLSVYDIPRPRKLDAPD